MDYCTFQIANKKGADQSVQMRRLVCAFIVHMQQSQVLSCQGPYRRGLWIWGFLCEAYVIIDLIKSVAKNLPFFTCFVLSISILIAGSQSADGQ